MNEDIEVYLNAESGSYLESLIKSRRLLEGHSLLLKLDEVIQAELELALMGANKAKSEILKSTKKGLSVVPMETE